MSKQFLIMPDVMSEGITVCPEHIFFADNDDAVELQIRKVSGKYPTMTILVYTLSQMMKLKGKPQYQRYKVTEKGEVLPV